MGLRHGVDLPRSEPEEERLRKNPTGENTASRLQFLGVRFRELMAGYLFGNSEVKPPGAGVLTYGLPVIRLESRPQTSLQRFIRANG